MIHPYFIHAAVPLSTILLGFGLNATFRPEAHLASLGFPAHAELGTKKLNSALMSIWGIRNISTSLLLLLIWSRKDEILMAKALGVATLLPLVDGLVSRRLIGGGELQHWSFPPVLAVVIAGLLISPARDMETAKRGAT